MTKKLKKLKVFGGTIFYGTPRKQVRVIIGSYTKKQAVELLCTVNNNFNYNQFNDYFIETGNDVELSVATDVGMWITKNEYDQKVENYIKIS